MARIADRVAVEALQNRRGSPIGTMQHHYRLRSPLGHSQGEITDVVVTVGRRAAYVFRGTPSGEICYNNYTVLAEAPVCSCEEVLKQLGYVVAQIAVA